MKAFCITMKQDTTDLVSYFSANGLSNIQMFQGINGNEIGNNYINHLPDTPYIASLGGINRVISTWGLYHLYMKTARRDHSQLGSWGSIGCALSHIQLWRNMVENNDQQILIFEDDVQFSPSFKTKLDNVLSNIPSDADMVVFDPIVAYDKKSYNDVFNRINDRFFGLHGYLITQNCVNKIGEYLFPIEVQIDSFLGFCAALDRIVIYSANGLCSQSIHISSVQTKTPCFICEMTENQVKNYNKTIAVILIFVMFFITYIIIKFLFKRNPSVGNH